MNVADKVWQVVREKRRETNAAMEKKRVELRNCMLAANMSQGIKALEQLKELETRLKVLDEIIEAADAM